MKKSLFFVAAASALMLTACSRENDVVQDATKNTVAVQQQAVGFDIYTPAATSVTRAGLEGTMTTSRLQRSEYEGGGFGVYAYQVQDAEGDATATTYKDWMTSSAKAPNFMVNEKLLWNATNQGWYYNPLKYWPNETNNDSQNTNAEMYGIGNNTNKHLDRLTFFAYAPYVETAVAGKPGITYFTNKNGKLTTGTVADESYSGESVKEASLAYTAAIDNPNEAVDLLWGVAPSGGLEYTAVNGQTVKVEEGMPLIDMTKPNVNTNMKFLFQHALARINVNAVAAIDQVGAGGKLDPNTKITINKITLTGYFGQTGILNLDNTYPSVAKWVEANGKVISKTAFGSLGTSTLTLKADHTNPDNGTIATHLQFVGTATDPSAASATPVAQEDRSGVTTIRQSVIQPALIDNTPGVNRNWYTMKKYNANELAYSETTPYYTDADCKVQATVTMPASYTFDSKGIITEAAENTAFKYPMVLENYVKGEWHQVTYAEVQAKTYDSYQAYSNYVKRNRDLKDNDYVYISDEVGYHQVNETGTYKTSVYSYKEALKKLDDGKYVPKSGTPKTGDWIITEGMLLYQVKGDNKDAFAGEQLYTKSGSTYIPKAVGSAPVTNDYVIVGEKEKVQPYYAAGSYYKRDANYFMVVPTNNFINENSALSSSEEKLRTVRVMIEYYITTEDGKLKDGRAQTKNVIEKDVVFPSLANGKSYNLNLILGLTSVKMEAEVDDWKVINVQADLPQNTAGE